jgi:hypothetical protein
MERMRFTCSNDKGNIGLCPVRPAELHSAAFRPAVFKNPLDAQTKSLKVYVPPAKGERRQNADRESTPKWI